MKTINIDAATHHKLKLIALQSNKTIKQVIVDLLELATDSNYRHLQTVETYPPNQVWSDVVK